MGSFQALQYKSFMVHCIFSKYSEKTHSVVLDTFPTGLPARCVQSENVGISASQEKGSELPIDRKQPGEPSARMADKTLSTLDTTPLGFGV